MKDVYFSQAWKKWQSKDESGDPTGNLDLNEAFRFLNDLMTQAKGTPMTLSQKKVKPMYKKNAFKYIHAFTEKPIPLKKANIKG